MSDYRLILFLTGDAPRSKRARKNLSAALDRVGGPDVTTDEIDVIQHPEAALSHGVFATPALALVTPNNDRQFLYGDLSDQSRLDTFLGTLVAP